MIRVTLQFPRFADPFAPESVPRFTPLTFDTNEKVVIDTDEGVLTSSGDTYFLKARRDAQRHVAIDVEPADG